MGCGDTFADVVTGGGYSAVGGGGGGGGSFIENIIHGVSNATGATTMANTTNAVLGNNDISRFLGGTARQFGTGGLYNIQQARKAVGFANVMDYLADPTRMNDRWIRGSGELLEEVPGGHDARKIAPNVLSVVGGIYGGPVGAMGGYYMGNKLRGGSDSSGLKYGAIAGGGNAIGNAASTYLGPVAGGAVGGAAAGAMQSAASGQDVGEGTWKGALGGAIGGAASMVSANYSNYLQNTYNLSPQVANAISNTLTKAGSGALGAYAMGRDPAYGALGGAASGLSGSATNNQFINNALSIAMKYGIGRLQANNSNLPILTRNAFAGQPIRNPSRQYRQPINALAYQRR